MLERIAISDSCGLRPLIEADADELYSCVDLNRSRLSVWLPWAAGQTRDGTLEFIRGAQKQVEEDNGMQLGVTCDGAIVGVVGFHGVDRTHRSTSLGYWLAESHEGYGTMTQAVRALVDHAFSAWDLNRVEIRSAPENVRSRAIPERLGFREEGRLREVDLVNDAYVDNIVYSTLSSGGCPV